MKSSTNSDAAFEDLGGRPAELGGALPDQVADPRWRRPFADHSLRRAHAQQLGEHERVARGQLLEARRRSARGADAHALEQFVDVGSWSSGGSRCGRRSRVRRALAVMRASCGDDVSNGARALPTTKTRFGIEQRRELSDHVEHRGARAVEVVDDHDDRRLGRERGDPPRRAAEHVLVAQARPPAIRPRPSADAIRRTRRCRRDRGGRGRSTDSSSSDRPSVASAMTAGERVQRGTEHVVDVDRQDDRVARELAGDVQEEARLADSRPRPRRVRAASCRRRLRRAAPAAARAPRRGRRRRASPAVHAGSGRHEPGVGRDQASRSWSSTRRSSCWISTDGSSPDLVAEGLAQRFAGAQRLGLATGAVQRGDLLRRGDARGAAPAATQASMSREHLEVATVDQVRVVAGLDQRHAQFVRGVRGALRRRRAPRRPAARRRSTARAPVEEIGGARRFVARERQPSVAQQRLGPEDGRLPRARHRGDNPFRFATIRAPEAPGSSRRRDTTTCSAVSG